MNPFDAVIVTATLVSGREAWEGVGVWPRPTTDPDRHAFTGQVFNELEAMVRTLVDVGKAYRLTLASDLCVFRGPEAEVAWRRHEAFLREGGSWFAWVPIKLTRPWKEREGSRG